MTKRMTNELDILNSIKEKIRVSKKNSGFKALEGLNEEVVLYINLEKKLDEGVNEGEMFLVVDFLGTSRATIAETINTNTMIFLFYKGESGRKLFEASSVLKELLEGLQDNVTYGSTWTFSSEISRYKGIEDTWFRFMQFNFRYKEMIS